MQEPVFTVIDVRGWNVRVSRAGAGTPVVVLTDVYGPTDWTPYLAKLAENFDVLVPEHPGFGGVAPPEWLDKVSDLANFYLDLLDHLDLRDVTLMGLGIGGWIAAELAVRNTGRLSRLVLANAAGLFVRNVPQADIFLGGEEEVIDLLVHDPAMAQTMKTELLVPETEDIRLHNQQTIARIAWQPRLHDPDLRKWLHRIDIPTLIVWGEHNKLFPLPYADTWQELLPKSKKVVLPGVGHLPQFEAPEIFVNAVSRFLADRKVPA